MVPASDLHPGAVVRLASGSIKFVVEAMPPKGSDKFSLIGWGDRVGVVRFAVSNRLLVWPRPPVEDIDLAPVLDD